MTDEQESIPEAPDFTIPGDDIQKILDRFNAVPGVAEAQRAAFSQAISPALETYRFTAKPVLTDIQQGALAWATKFEIPSALTAFAESQRSAMVEAVQPLLGAQSIWKAQQEQLMERFAPALAAIAESQRSVMEEAIQPFLNSQSIWQEHLAALQGNWAADFASTIAAMRKAFYPPNLRDIEGVTLEMVQEVVMVEGIALYGLPRASIAEALMYAEGTVARREILGRRWKAISADCRAVVERCTSEAVAPYTVGALAALDALDAGHVYAAQALAGSLIDATLTQYFGDDRYKYTPDKNGKRTQDAYDEFSARRRIAFAPMWQTYQQFFVKNGDEIPMTFSRNATAHTVDSRQFNRRNAVQGIMIACSFLCRLDEEARRASSN